MAILTSGSQFLTKTQVKLREASELYAYSQGSLCSGTEVCHWCCSPCDRKYMHDDPPPIPFTRSKSTARKGDSLFVCQGCYLWRLKRITIRFHTGRFQDRQEPCNHSWLITDGDSIVLDPLERSSIYPLILTPPLRFSLSLLSNPKVFNLLQLQKLNDFQEIKADTLLHYTLDNTPLTYTIYELEEGLRHGANGKMPGVRALIEHLGSYTLPEEKRERGRPVKGKEIKAENIVKRVVTR